MPVRGESGEFLEQVHDEICSSLTTLSNYMELAALAARTPDPAARVRSHLTAASLAVERLHALAREIGRQRRP